MGQSSWLEREPREASFASWVISPALVSHRKPSRDRGPSRANKLATGRPRRMTRERDGLSNWNKTQNGPWRPPRRVKCTNTVFTDRLIH